MKNKILQTFGSMRRYAAMLLLLVMCVTHAWAADDDTRTVFLDINPCSWYTNDGYYPRIWVAKDDSKNQTYEIDYTEIITTGVYRFEIAKEARCIQFIRYNGSTRERWSGDIWINSDDANSACCYKYHNYFKLDNNAATVSDANKTSFSSSGEYLYFYADNLTTTTAVQFVMGRWNHYATTDMNLLTNTEKLYYCTGAYYNDAYSYFSIMGNGSSWDSNTKGFNDIISYASDYTAAKYGYKFNSGSTYYATKSSTSKGSAVSIESKSGYSAIPKYATTLNIKVREASGGAYSNGSTSDKPAATIKITGTYLSGNGTTGRSDAEWSENSSCSYETVISGKVTPSYASLDGDWQFDGWFYEGAGSSASTGTSFDFYQTSATTVEARFTRLKYDITLNNNGATSPGSTSVKATYGATTNLTSNISVPSKTGYTFGGYYTDEDCTETQLINASGAWQTGNSWINASNEWIYTSDVTFYAKWTPKTTTISFNVDGGSAIDSKSATYDATMPSISKPTKDGYFFDGIYDAAVGGTQYYDENAASARTWNKEDASVTLYAHWTKSELTNIALTPTDYAVQDEHPTITATPTLSISSGIGTTSICWGLYTDAGCTTPVDGVSFSPNPSAGAGAVTFTAPDAAGTYYLKAIFRAGSTCEGTELNSFSKSFVVHPTNTVTVKAKVGEEFIPDAEYNQTSHTVIVNTHRATEVAVPDIEGYTFVNWTLGSNMAKTDAELTANPIHITATAASTLTANYNYASYEVSYPSNAAYTISNNDASVIYKSTGRFTVEPAAGYSIVVTASDASGSIDIHQDVNNYSFKQGKYPVTITITPTEVTNTVTVVNGTPTSVTAQVVSTASADVTADPAPAGKKFLTWYLGTGIVLTKGDTTSRTIAFHASQNTTITAVYTDRTKKTVHFAKPTSWSTVTAKFSNSSGSVDPSDKMTHVSTFTYEGATYYTFSYYTDNNREGDDQSAHASWDRVTFSEDGSTADGKHMDDLTITDGYYYAYGAPEQSSGHATPFAEWYLRGNLNKEANWTEADGRDFFLYPFSVSGTTAEFAFGAQDIADNNNQYFRLYRVTTREWFRTQSESANRNLTIPATETLYVNSSNADVISTNTAEKKGVYLFRITNIHDANPGLTVTHPADTKYGVTITSGDHGSLAGGTGSITQLGRYMPTDISATANAGYRFKEWVTTGGVVVKNPTSASTTATATSAGTLTATFTNEGIVYLDVSALTGWSGRTPTVYFYSGSYWDSKKGSGSKNILYGGEPMSRIGDSHVWYYDYSGTSMGISGTRNYIAFTDHEQDGYDNFASCSAIYRGDFYPAMNTFVPQSTSTGTLNGSAAYYNNGYWMKYNEAESGYNVRIYDGQGNGLQQTIHLTTESIGDRNSYTATCHVDGAADAKFELVGHDMGYYNGVDYAGTFYGNTGTIKGSMSEWWPYSHGVGKSTLKCNSNGDYIFHLKCGDDGKLYAKVTFPIAVNDFRIKYYGLIETDDAERGNLFSNVIPCLTSAGTRTDKVSFFIAKDATLTPELYLQKCTAVDNSTGTITWGDAAESFAAEEGTDITALESGVYVFEVTQTYDGSSTRTFTYKNLGLYDGKYYVRTDCAHGGWVGYKQNSDNLMHETNYDEAGYNHYYCRYIEADKNIKFCVANDYNSNLTKEIVDDDINTKDDDNGTIKVAANTRFEYDNTTNKVSRSYVGSSADATFLYIRDTDPDKIFKENGTSEGVALTNDTAKFFDNENWIYSLEVRAIPGAKYKLEAKINGNIQYFVGTAGTDEKLLGGSGSKQKMRLVYDFKNNHLIKAWLPSGVVSGAYDIDADVMLIREGQNAATQLIFSDADSKLEDVHNVYGVLGFKKTDMTNGSLSSYERSLYWISFPFDVKLKDIFGFGTYGEDFIVRRYNGAKRAEKGWFLGDGTNTFWETMSPDSVKEADNTMKAYEGYMVALDKGLFIGSDSRWYADEKPIDELYLYFPSASAEIGELSKTDKVITLDSMKCTINRTFTQDSELAEDKRRNHKNTDSNWRVVGVGSLHNSQITTTDLDDKANSIDYYAWDASLNKLNSTTCNQYGSGSPTTFLAGHAYMVQWEGKITWKSASVPASVAARRSPIEKKNYEVELDLNQNDIMYDRTYVVLQENASPEYVLNEDLYKATNSNYPNIYAFAGAYDCGVSRIPIESTTVPVGVIIRKNGTYTFSMPSNFDGTVTLIDTYSQTRTNLGLEDYEVYLNKGTMDDRFLLEININKVPTAIDGVMDGSGSLKDGNAHKFIMNDMMYILKDGVIYDARGNRVK